MSHTLPTCFTYVCNWWSLLRLPPGRPRSARSSTGARRSSKSHVSCGEASVPPKLLASGYFSSSPVDFPTRQLILWKLASPEQVFQRERWGVGSDTPRQQSPSFYDLNLEVTVHHCSTFYSIKFYLSKVGVSKNL